jgi:hypothetical protein
MSKLQGIFVQYRIHGSKRLSQNFSFWETGFACPATLILIEKAGFRPLFRKPIPKLTEFWDWLPVVKIL